MAKIIETTNSTIDTEVATNVFHTVAYFSLFEYPLQINEIQNLVKPGTAPQILELSLAHLVSAGNIHKIGPFYSLSPNEDWISRRLTGNRKAEELLPKAIRIGRFLSKFPFVRGVAISGSLSKMYADEKADIDFFIVTRADRLWIARTLMHLYKKLTYLRGREHYYCMNYYVDEKALELTDQNIYTGIETITLLPVAGKGIEDFFAANPWVGERFSRYAWRDRFPQLKNEASRIKAFTEWILSNRFGNWLDNYLMKLTGSRWKRKKMRGLRNHEGRTMDLVTGKHFARSNPGMFQEKLLALFHKKIQSVNYEMRVD